jgi:hypothetical protein
LGVVVAAAVAGMASKIMLHTGHHLMYNVDAIFKVSKSWNAVHDGYNCNRTDPTASNSGTRLSEAVTKRSLHWTLLCF